MAPKDTLRYILGPEGFCSELNNFLLGCIFAERLNLEIVVDDSEAPLYFSKGFSRFFVPVNEGKSHGLLSKTIKRGNPLWHEMRSQTYTFDEKRLAAKKHLNYQSWVETKISAIKDKFGFEEPYGCIHLRRGDKVGARPSWTHNLNVFKKIGRLYRSGFIHEAQPISAKTYLLKVCDADPKLKRICVCTDDFRAFIEAREAADALGMDVVSTCDERSRGHSTLERTLKNRAYTEDEVVTLIADLAIASESQVFVGTYSSNIGRYIALIHDNPKRCFSLDKQWHPY